MTRTLTALIATLAVTATLAAATAPAQASSGRNEYRLRPCRTERRFEGHHRRVRNGPWLRSVSPPRNIEFRSPDPFPLSLRPRRVPQRGAGNFVPSGGGGAGPGSAAWVRFPAMVGARAGG